MTALVREGRAALEWGWAGRALESESGDLHVVVPFDGGALVALLDGLGHGPEAAAASNAALPVLQKYTGDSLLLLVEHCHRALTKTRGVAMSLAAFRTGDSSMMWLGIGNVDAVLIRASVQRQEAIHLRGGVVGYRLPPLRADTLLVSPGDTLIMTTDGIRSGCTAGLRVDHSPQEIAESMLACFTKGTDDAHVLVARYVGGGS